MHEVEANATWHFSIISISLSVEVAQILDFLVAYMLKSCRFENLFQLEFTPLYSGQERHSSYFFYV